MKVNLELKKAEMIKEFNFSINEEYEVKVYGQKTVTKTASKTTSSKTSKTKK